MIRVEWDLSLNFRGRHRITPTYLPTCNLINVFFCRNLGKTCGWENWIRCSKKRHSIKLFFTPILNLWRIIFSKNQLFGFITTQKVICYKPVASPTNFFVEIFLLAQLVLLFARLRKVNLKNLFNLSTLVKANHSNCISAKKLILIIKTD